MSQNSYSNVRGGGGTLDISLFLSFFDDCRSMKTIRWSVFSPTHFLCMNECMKDRSSTKNRNRRNTYNRPQLTTIVFYLSVFKEQLNKIQKLKMVNLKNKIIDLLISIIVLMKQLQLRTFSYSVFWTIFLLNLPYIFLRRTWSSKHVCTCRC